MSKMKKFAGLLLALVMVLSMAITASAATITGPSDGHTYKVYQIITGTLANGTLSDMQWGSDAKKTGAVSEEDANALAALTNLTDRAEIAKEVAEYAYLSTVAATLTNTAPSATVTDGYYIIVDEGPAGENETLSLNLVKVAGTITISAKRGTVDFEKKIKDTNDTTGAVTQWQDSADYDIGDSIPFKLEATVASNYADFETYYLAFHDKEEKGLAFEGITSVKIVNVVDGETVETPVTADKYSLVTENLNDGCSFEVIFNQLENVEAVKAGSKVVVEYTSKLTSDANLGKPGNVNEAKAEFSNNPNDTQVGKPGGTGETPWDNVIVFTYKVVVNKYANSVSEATKLPGAEFTLEKLLPNGQKKAIAVVKSSDGTSFEFKGLDDGDYVLTESKTPDGYNTIAPIEFKVTAEHDVVWESGKETRETVLKSLSGNKATGEILFTPSTDLSTLSRDVINKSGATLPETGGMGTTMFYLIGALCVVCAGVLLISKKRVAR